MECVYCGATSHVQSSPDGAVTAPALRVAPPPPVESGVPGQRTQTVLLGGLATLLAVIAAFEDGKDRFALIGFGLALAAAAFISGLATVRAGREYREKVWFRENGIPGRATVLEIRAGNDGTERLTLELETAGQAVRRLEHAAHVPPLLIPRFTQGVSLPVIVHPHNESMLEIQWHLV